jgi:hypothetical protein
MADDDDSSWESLADHNQQHIKDISYGLPNNFATLAPPLEQPVVQTPDTIIDYDDDPIVWDDLELKDNYLHAPAIHSQHTQSNFSNPSVCTDRLVLESTTTEYDSDWQSLTTEQKVGSSGSNTRNRWLRQDDRIPASAETSQPSSIVLNNLKLHPDSKRISGKTRNAFDKLPMDVLCSNFVLNLLREVWYKNWQIQVASVITGLGMACTSIRYTIWYAYSPRQMIGLLLLLVPYTYLQRQSIHNTMDNLMQAFSDPSYVSKIVADFSPLNFRYGSILFMYILPLSIEIWTLHSLLVIHSDLGSHALNVSVASLLLISMYLNWNVWKRPLKLCQEVSIWILYGSSLSLAIQHCHWYRIPQLAGPFLLPTGTLWLKDFSRQNPDLLSQSIQGALRRSIREAFDVVTSMIEEDEMFYLTMIRWIVDYWNIGSKKSEATSQHSQKSNVNDIASTNTINPNISASRHKTMGRESHGPPEDSSIDWSDMSKMLSLVTDQIEAEVEMKQETNSSNGSNQSQQGKQSTTESQRFPKSNCKSLSDLHRMFATMDLDEKMKPLIAEYNRKVKAIPPSKELATLLALSVRCPTVLLFTWQLFFGTLGSLSSNTIVFALVGFECLRLFVWMHSCHTMSTPAVSSRDLIDSILNADPMKLLLLDDSNATIESMISNTTHPTLLIVWHNVQHSVVALDKGLSTARCIQTVNASVDFAFHLISLVHFGMEVSERGWMHGLSVIVRELTALHQRKHDDPMDHTALSHTSRVTDATIGTIRSSQVLHRNLQIMLDDRKKQENIEKADAMPDLSFENSKKHYDSVDFLSIAKKSQWLTTDAMEKCIQLHMFESLQQKQESHCNDQDQNFEEKAAIQIIDDAICGNEFSAAVQKGDGDDITGCTADDKALPVAVMKQAMQPTTCSSADACESIVQLDKETTDPDCSSEQTDQSDDLRAIAKKSKWLASDAMQKSLKLHVAD